MTYWQYLTNILERKYKVINIVEYTKYSTQVIDSALIDMYLKGLFFKNDSFWCISEFMSNNFSIPLIDRSDLFRYFGYSRRKLHDLLIKVKRKRVNITMLGVGGLGLNFLYWLNEMALYTKVKNIIMLFRYYDEDELDLTNIFRLPFDITNANKFSSLKKVDIASKIKQYAISGKNSYSHERFFTKKDIEELKINNAYNTLLLGGPDIQTREELFKAKDTLIEKNIYFLSMTHANNEVDLKTFPIQDSDLQIESYGTIELNYFFLNMIRGTLKVLESIADDSYKDLDWSFNAKEYTKTEEANKNISNCSKKYEF